MPEDSKPADQPADRPRPFRLHPLNIVGFAMVIAAGLFILILAAIRGGDAEKAGEAAGRLVGMILLPLALGYGTYRAGGRSSRSGNISLGVILSIMILAMGAGVWKGWERARNAKAFSTLSEVEAIERRSRQAALDGDLTGALDDSDRAVDKLREAASGAAGVEKRMLEFSASMAERRNSLIKKYLDAINAFTDKGGMDAEDLADLPTLTARAAELDAAIALHTEVMTELSGAVARIRTELAALGASKAQIESFLRGMNRNGQADTVLRIQACERDMLSAMARRLALLRTHHGRWKVGESGAVRIGEGIPPEDAAELDGYTAVIEELAARQEKLQELLREAPSQPPRAVNDPK